jgi:hypothetical protein
LTVAISKASGRPDPPDPADDEATDEKMYTSAPIEDDEGATYIIRQQNVGPGNELGGGEWPDPDTPSTDRPRSPE